MWNPSLTLYRNETWKNEQKCGFKNRLESVSQKIQIKMLKLTHSVVPSCGKSDKYSPETTLTFHFPAVSVHTRTPHSLSLAGAHTHAHTRHLAESVTWQIVSVRRAARQQRLCQTSRSVQTPKKWLIKALEQQQRSKRSTASNTWC